jgi:hypothetical protein
VTAAPFFLRELMARCNIRQPYVLTPDADSGYCLDAVEVIPLGSMTRFDPFREVIMNTGLRSSL